MNLKNLNAIPETNKLFSGHMTEKNLDSNTQFGLTRLG